MRVLRRYKHPETGGAMLRLILLLLIVGGAAYGLRAWRSNPNIIEDKLMPDDKPVEIAIADAGSDFTFDPGRMNIPTSVGDLMPSTQSVLELMNRYITENAESEKPVELPADLVDVKDLVSAVNARNPLTPNQVMALISKYTEASVKIQAFTEGLIDVPEVIEVSDSIQVLASELELSPELLEDYVEQALALQSDMLAVSTTPEFALSYWDYIQDITSRVFSLSQPIAGSVGSSFMEALRTLVDVQLEKK